MTNNLTVTGTVIQNLPTETGKSKTGNDWKKRTVVVQQDDKFNTPVALTLFGKAADFKTTVGEKIEASVNLKSREYNGRYYSDIEAWSVKSSNTANTQEQFAGVDTDDSGNLPF